MRPLHHRIAPRLRHFSSQHGLTAEGITQMTSKTLKMTYRQTQTPFDIFFCSLQDCAYFFFNTIGSEENVFLMKLELKASKVNYSKQPSHPRTGYKTANSNEQLLFIPNNSNVRLWYPHLWLLPACLAGAAL